MATGRGLYTYSSPSEPMAGDLIRPYRGNTGDPAIIWHSGLLLMALWAFWFHSKEVVLATLTTVRHGGRGAVGGAWQAPGGGTEPAVAHGLLPSERVETWRA
ncbi:hypothetical protein GCM10022402_03960 [Salinactinospora qingdaonensis]|uniref:Uncharacterized protein n=1 Tax=Salinactinospora qingdaonensis TaxID=702744 RepID=A0ABP7EZR4_9ACTN